MTSARVDGARQGEGQPLVRMMGFCSSEQTGLKGDDTVFLPLPNKVRVHHSVALSLSSLLLTCGGGEGRLPSADFQEIQRKVNTGSRSGCCSLWADAFLLCNPLPAAPHTPTCFSEELAFLHQQWTAHSSYLPCPWLATVTCMLPPPRRATADG